MPWSGAFALACTTQMFRVDPVTLAGAPLVADRGGTVPEKLAPKRFEIAMTAFAADGVHAAWGCLVDPFRFPPSGDAICMLRANGEIAVRQKGSGGRKGAPRGF